MNTAEELFRELEAGESPLFSAYVTLRDEVDQRLALEGFLALVQDLIEEGSVDLWSVDHVSHTRTRLAHVPTRLHARYSAIDAGDGSYDPFGLSLTLTEQQSHDRPDWELDLDFANREFSLRSPSGDEEPALERVARYYPHLRFQIARRLRAGGFTKITGSFDELAD